MANLLHFWGSISAEFKKLSSVCSLLLNYILVLVYASYSIYLFTLQLEIHSQLSVHLWQQLGCCWAKRQMTWRPLVIVISQDESAPCAVHHWKSLPPAVLAQSPEQEPNLTSSSSVWTPLRTKILQIKQEQIHNIKLARTTMKLSTRGLKDVFTCGA